MSQRDIEIIRRGYAALNRGDVEAWLDAFHVDAKMYDLAGGPEAPARQGHNALREWARTMDEIWEEGRHEPQGFIDAGDFVVVAVRARGRRRGIDVPVDIPLFHVFEMRDGKIHCGRAYLDQTEALEAVGLSERAMSQEDANVIRRAYEVWNESGPAAVTEQFWAEDAVYREGPGWPDAGVFEGRAAALARMQRLVELVGPITVHLDELIDLGDGRFVAYTRMVGESAASNPPYTQEFAVVQRLRDGLVVEADYYLDRSQALEAAGLQD